MHKSFRVFIYLVLFGSCVNHGAAQTTNPQGHPVTNLNKSKSPIPSASVTASEAEPNAEARELLESGMKRAELGLFSEAVEDLQQALKLQPDYSAAYSALGRVYFKLREWQKAVDNLHRAAALKTKERQRQDALQYTLTSGKREDVGALVRSTPESSKETKTQPATNANPAALKTSAPASIKSQQDAWNEPISASKATTTSSQNKTPQTSIPVVGVTTSTSTAVARQLPNQRTEQGPITSTAGTSLQIKAPQESDVNPADAKTSAYKQGKSEQPKQSNSPSNVISTGSEGKQAPEAKPDIPVVKTGAPETAQQSEKQKEGSTQAKSTATTQRLPAEVGTQSPKSETVRPQPKVEPPSVALVPIPSPAKTESQQGVTANAEQAGTYDAKAATALAVTTSPRNTAASQGGGFPQKQEADGAELSTNVKPESSTPETRNAIPNSINSSAAEESLTRVYRVGPSDVLDIRMNDIQTQRSTLFTVSPTGLLEHPMLAEPLLVTGLTAEEIRSRIENEVIRRALIENPNVAVGVREYASHSIIVSGLVKDSGTKFLRREAIPLYVVVADAQPLPEAAKATVVRNDLKQIYEIDLTRAAELDLLVRPGDVVTLHPNVTQFVYIGGEVKFPGERQFRRGLTLTQAIISSGVTQKAKEAEIARDDGRGFLVGTRFNLKDIKSGKVVDPFLRPGDRVTILP